MKYIALTSLIVSCLMANTSYAQENAPLAAPAIFGPLKANPNPFHVDGGEYLGKVYISGVASGLARVQNHHSSADKATSRDLSNGQIIIQKNEGLVQFHVQAGSYAIPSLGTTYFDSEDTTDNFYGSVPIAYVTLAPSEHFSIQAGKMYPIIGTESTFSFQNANIERGLLWNQTAVVSQGVQANYFGDSFSASVALTDGFYSGELNWLSSLVNYKFNQNHSVTFIASGSLSSENKSTLATPLAQNNSQIYDLNYVFTKDAWTVSPTFQLTYVPEDTKIGINDSALSYAAGVTAIYKFNDNWSLAGRGEYIDTRGTTNLLYGAASNAWSATITPTYQKDLFFARLEGSYVKATDTTAGSVFSVTGTETDQARLMLETGIIF